VSAKSLGLEHFTFIGIAFALFSIGFTNAYADVQIDGTIISGSSDTSVVNLKIQDTDGNLIWKKSLEVDENFEIEMPRLEAGEYMLLVKYGNIGGESEVLEFTYDGPEPEGTFELIIELPNSAGEDFGIYAEENEAVNFQRLGDFILSSDEPIRALEVIVIQMDNGVSIARENLDTVQRWTPDGIETLEYGIFWTEHRAYNDIKRLASKILDLIDDGMSLESAFAFFNFDSEPPEPEPEPVPEPTPVPVPEPTPEQTPKIPDWVRNIFIWYAEDRISEDELLEAIQFLIDQGILQSR